MHAYPCCALECVHDPDESNIVELAHAHALLRAAHTVPRAANTLDLERPCNHSLQSRCHGTPCCVLPVWDDDSQDAPRGRSCVSRHESESEACSCSCTHVAMVYVHTHLVIWGSGSRASRRSNERDCLLAGGGTGKMDDYDAPSMRFGLDNDYEEGECSCVSGAGQARHAWDWTFTDTWPSFL